MTSSTHIENRGQSVRTGKSISWVWAWRHHVNDNDYRGFICSIKYSVITTWQLKVMQYVGWFMIWKYQTEFCVVGIKCPVDNIQVGRLKTVRNVACTLHFGTNGIKAGGWKSVYSRLQEDNILQGERYGKYSRGRRFNPQTGQSYHSAEHASAQFSCLCSSGIHTSASNTLL